MAEGLIDATDSETAHTSERAQAAEGWQAGDVCWMHVKGQPHAFDHFATRVGDKETLRVRERDSMYQTSLNGLKTSS